MSENDSDLKGKDFEILLTDVTFYLEHVQTLIKKAKNSNIIGPAVEKVKELNNVSITTLRTAHLLSM